jgi:hypothetical protein
MLCLVCMACTILTVQFTALSLERQNEKLFESKRGMQRALLLHNQG